MFKWICLIVAVAFLSGLSWMINDVRLEVRRSTELARKTLQKLDDQVPPLLEKIRASTDSLSEELPEVLNRIRKSTETLGDLADDIRQLKELIGASNSVRDKSLVIYADGVLDAIENSNGLIGLKKTLGSGLKNELQAKEWITAARKEALLLTITAKSKQEFLNRLTDNKFGSPWQIQFDQNAPMDLLEWLKANHAPTRDLLAM